MVFRFADELEKNFKTIASHPDAFAIRYKDVRGKLVQKFPYLILYTANHETESIEILRLFNTYQKPYWK